MKGFQIMAKKGGVPKSGGGVNRTTKGAGSGKNPGGSGHVPVGQGKPKGGVTPSQNKPGTAGRSATQSGGKAGGYRH
jgi:hypothetical protein